MAPKRLSVVLPPPAQEKLTSAFHRTDTWDRRLKASGRTALVALARMGSKAGERRCASFRWYKDAERSRYEDVTLRFPEGDSLEQLQRAVAKHFDWADGVIVSVPNGLGWELPIWTNGQLGAAFASWERSSAPRIRFKYDELFSEVEGLLCSADVSEQLRGASASWELACRASHHELLGEAFIEALSALLASGAFAPTCLAAAAVHTLLSEPATAARFPTSLAELVHRALRTTYSPPPSAELAAQCRGSSAFLARQPVHALHRMLDSALPDHARHAKLLSRSHAELALWRMLLRVAPRHAARPGSANATDLHLAQLRPQIQHTNQATQRTPPP